MPTINNKKKAQLKNPILAHKDYIAPFFLS